MRPKQDFIRPIQEWRILRTKCRVARLVFEMTTAGRGRRGKRGGVPDGLRGGQPDPSSRIGVWVRMGEQSRGGTRGAKKISGFKIESDQPCRLDDFLVTPGSLAYPAPGTMLMIK